MKFLLIGTCAIALASLGASLPGAADATQPSCGAGDVVVWENASTKVYHTQGDAYFGKTKHGQYACKSDADKAGFHLSKSRVKAGAMGANDATATDAPQSVASPMTGRHHRHTRGAMASPAADAAPGTMPSPGAMMSPDAMMSPGAMASPSGRHHRHHRGAALPSPMPAAT